MRFNYILLSIIISATGASLAIVGNLVAGEIKTGEDVLFKLEHDTGINPN
jgi:hypothetical protein